MNSGIYRIRNILNNHIYIGSTNDFYVRKIGHFYLLRTNQHHSIYLQRAFNKYGESNFVFEPIELVVEIDLLTREQWYLDTLQPEYNISKIAGRIEFTPEIREKISIALTGTKRSDITKQKISSLKKGNTIWLGKHHSEESKMKIKKARMLQKPPMLGKFHSIETRSKIASQQLGKKRGPALTTTKEHIRQAIILHWQKRRMQAI